MGQLSDYRIERDRDEAQRRAANLRHDYAGNGQKYLGTVFDGGSMAASLPAWFLTYPTQVTGDEVEGDQGAFLTDTMNPNPVLVIGTTVPLVGDVLPARMINGFWVAERGGGMKSGCSICINVCAALSSGLTVDVYSGSILVGSDTTNSTGCVSISGLASGTYTVKVYSGSTLIYSASTAIVCPGGKTITISGPDSSECCFTCPIPDTLTLTDSISECTLTYIPLFNSWQGEYFFSQQGYTTDNSSGACLYIAGTITQRINYTMICLSPGVIAVGRSWLMMMCAEGVCGYGDTNAACSNGPYNGLFPCRLQGYPILVSVNSGVSSAYSSCAPFAWSGTLLPGEITDCFGCGSGELLDPVSGTVAISG